MGMGNGARVVAEHALEDDVYEELEHNLPEELVLTLAEYKRQWVELYEWLRSNGRRHHAAWLLSSSCSGTGHWLTWRGGSDGRFRFGVGEYEECLRLRLLVDPYVEQGNMVCTMCGTAFRDAPLHALDCQRSQVARRYRHDRVRNHLKDLLRQCYSDAAVTMEEPIGWMAVGLEGTGRGTKADVCMRRGPLMVIFDIAIVEPSAPTYLAMGSDSKAATAAIHREEAKRAAFTALGMDAAVQFVPFVVEATGRLGPAALAYFIDHFEDDHRARGQEFLAKVSATIAKWNAKIIVANRADMARTPAVARRQEVLSLIHI